MSKNSKILFILGIFLFLTVVLVAFPLIVMQVVRTNTNQALMPLQNANNQIQTRVSDLLHPTPIIIPDPVTIIHEVRSLARLETIQYTVEKVITAEMGQGNFAFLFGDKLLFVAHGYVIAGIDLGKLTSDNLWLQGNVLYARLPVPEVFVATLDNEKSYVYDRETGLLIKPYNDLETKARQAAEQEILKAAVSDGILDQAKQNGENYMTRLFKTLGYNEVVFVISTPQP
jgi:hypothetical protein